MIPSVRYLRMFTNAVAGGVLVASYIAVLIFQVNPQLPAISTTALGWFGAVIAFYSPYLTVLLYFLILGRDLVALRPLRPAWLSVRMLAWLGTVGAGAAATLTWANLRVFSAVLSEDAVARMRAGAAATTSAAVLLGLIAILRYSFGRRGSRTVGILLVVTLLLSIAVPMVLRGPGDPAVRLPRRDPADTRANPRLLVSGSAFAPRVRVLALDGASLGFIRQRVGAGQLPNFARMLDRGAAMDLATLTPTQAEPVWVAAGTGKSAEKNGVRSKVTYRVNDTDTDAADVLPRYCFAYLLPEQGFLRTTHPTSASLNARTLWEILADYGITTGIAGWPLTYPAHAARGYIVSDNFDDAASSPLRLADARAADPTTAVDVAREIFDRWLTVPWRDVLPTLTSDRPEPPGLNRVRWDLAYEESAAELATQFSPRFTAVRYEGLAELGHVGLFEAEPELFGEARRADAEGSVLDQYYAYLDAQIGDAMHALAPGDLLIVMSGFGMEPASWFKRLRMRAFGAPDLTGTHEPAPDGFFLAYGTNVATGQFPRGSVADLAPTVLYYMGVDVGRDMDGFPRTDLFLATYLIDHPVRYVASHER
jgi:hypothetical protein